MSNIDYLRIYADAEGCSHFEINTVDLASQDYAPPAPTLNTSKGAAAEKIVFLELPVEWYGVWHPTPVRQWLILMSGACEFEAGDGERAIHKAGDVGTMQMRTSQGKKPKYSGTSRSGLPPSIFLDGCVKSPIAALRVVAIKPLFLPDWDNAPDRAASN